MDTQDKEIVTIQKEAKDIVSRATSYQITSDVTYEKATEVISWIKGVIKQIEEKRLFHTKPLNDQIKKENELYKSYAKPFVEARNIMDDKMLEYHREQQKKIDAENERIRQEAEKIAKKEKVSVEEIMASTEQKEIPVTVGTATVRKNWTFEIVDETKVPRDFLMVNRTKVGEAVRQGARKISGINIFEKEIIATR